MFLSSHLFLTGGLLTGSLGLTSHSLQSRSYPTPGPLLKESSFPLSIGGLEVLPLHCHGRSSHLSRADDTIITEIAESVSTVLYAIKSLLSP